MADDSPLPPTLYLDANLQAQLAEAMQGALAQIGAILAIERSFLGQTTPAAKPGDTVPASGGTLQDQPVPQLLSGTDHVPGSVIPWSADQAGPFGAGFIAMPFGYEASLVGADFAGPVLHVAAQDSIPALSSPLVAAAITQGDTLGLSDGTWLSFCSMAELNGAG